MDDSVKTMGNTLHLQRTIGLAGASALVVGGVIGAGIFVMVRDIGALAGPAIWLSFVIAITVSMIGVIPLIQLAGALPTAGAGYMFASRMLSPCMGVLVSAWVLLGGACSVSVATRTLAQYMQGYILEGIPVGLMAAGILAVFYGIYSFGVRLAMSLQLVLAVQFLSALLLYGLAGAFHSGLDMTLQPVQGANGFLMSILLCYAICMGFQIIAEMGEEIQDARRTIPRALLIGGLIVAFIYILVGSVFVTTIPYDAARYAAMNAPLRESATLFLPAALVHFIGLGALTAGAAALNAAALTLPRELFALARDGILPRTLANIDPRSGAPRNAVTVYFILVGMLLLGQFETDFYGYMAATGVLAISSALGVAAIRLCRRFPRCYSDAYIQFPKSVLVICAGITIAASLGFGLVVAYERPWVLAAYAAWTLTVCAGYRLRTRNFTDDAWRKMTSFQEESNTDTSTAAGV
ncbi:MAG: putative amino acid permease YhdG [Candidatus Hydrogenedentes bacterium ADurb.Bin101]|mgnify:FL=1|jgi:APA family basic amino acid/polyamine antiporter|nr:MAG: putative amino acid permease YhdG [Candidatus Hydrogenedentes bacterium ADurb.Bin101]HOC67596.1 APC family permease [Candidatus Hydrogenedentota bacterium]